MSGKTNIELELSVVTTLYKSKATVIEFYRRTKAVIDKLDIQEYEIIFVDDGCPENSKQTVLDLQSEDSRIVVVELSRNFGHMNALHAGISESSGNYTFIIDSDLEEKPELLEEFYHKIRESEDVDSFYGVLNKRTEPIVRRLLSKLYYFLISMLLTNPYPKDHLVVRIISRRLLDAMKQFPERQIDIFAVLSMVGFNQLPVRVDKTYKGSSSYTFSKLMGIAINSVTALQAKPVSVFLKTALVFLGISVLLVTGINYFALDNQWILPFSIVIIGALNLVYLGVLVAFVSKWNIEMKKRPPYIIKQIHRK